MPSEDAWKRPFRELRDKFCFYYDSYQSLYHQVVFFPHYEAMDPQQCQELLEFTDLGFDGNKVIREILTPGSRIAKHVHYFYGRNLVQLDSACTLLERELVHAVDWISNIPSTLVPQFVIPKYGDPRKAGLIAWTSLVYFLANQIDSPYLSCEITCGNHDETLEAWELWPKPREFDPLKLLFHHVDPYEEVELWKEVFWGVDDDDYYLPDMIDGCLVCRTGVPDFITSSVTAIDCLLYMWEPIVKERKDAASPKQAATRTRSRTTRIKREEAWLKQYLLDHMRKAEADLSLKPLKWEEIARAMEWFNKDGKPLQPRVTRRMQQIFGPRPMEKYQACYGSDGGIKKGIFILMADGSFSLDGIENPVDTWETE